jgi:hypothetical protein
MRCSNAGRVLPSPGRAAAWHGMHAVRLGARRSGFERTVTRTYKASYRAGAAVTQDRSSWLSGSLLLLGEPGTHTRTMTRSMRVRSIEIEHLRRRRRRGRAAAVRVTGTGRWLRVTCWRSIDGGCVGRRNYSCDSIGTER